MIVDLNWLHSFLKILKADISKELNFFPGVKTASGVRRRLKGSSPLGKSLPTATASCPSRLYLSILSRRFCGTYSAGCLKRSLRCAVAGCNRQSKI
jgi:hypothetical protein